MFKKDQIFWWASSIFILSLILFAVTQNNLFLASMILAYLLRPTLGSLGLAKKYIDERQLSLNHRSSNIAFVVMLITCVIFATKLSAENNAAREMFNLVIVIGIAVKALFNVILSKNFREGAAKIIIAVGLFAALFSGMSSIDHGLLPINFLISILPGLLIAGLGVLSKYFPRVIAVSMLLITIILVVFILNKGIIWGQIATALLIGVPLLAASLGLWLEPKPITEVIE